MITEMQPIDRINAAKRSLEILKKMEGKPWTALPVFSPGHRIGRRCADVVVDLTIAMAGKGK